MGTTERWRFAGSACSICGMQECCSRKPRREDQEPEFRRPCRPEVSYYYCSLKFYQGGVQAMPSPSASIGVGIQGRIGLPVGVLVECASEGGISASGFSVSGNFDKELPESRKGHDPKPV